MSKDLEYMYACQNFLSWVKVDDDTHTLLSKANLLSKVLFNKPYESLWTYEKKYIAQQLAKAQAC